MGESGQSGLGRCESLQDAIFNINGRDLVNLLDFDALRCHLWNRRLRFLTDTEFKQVMSKTTYERRSTELMELLFEKREDVKVLRRFVACLMVEKTHTGHEELVEMLLETIPLREHKKITHIVQESWGCLTQPVSLIELEGYLKSKEFLKFEEKLWQKYHIGQFDEVKQLIDCELSLTENEDNIDLQIFGLLFKSTACVQQSGSLASFGEAMDELFFALELCDDPGTQNRIVLEGRVRQRMAQVLLYRNRKKSANEYLERAEQSIVFVGERYDRSKFYLRRAKVLSVSTPNSRKEIEKLYGLAMITLDPHDAHYPVCHPSVCLSKAAFHLNIAFGSDPKGELLPVSSEDLASAKHAAITLRENAIESMPKRKCEYKLVIAEIYRLEGDALLARQVFQETIVESEAINYTTVLNHAKSRLQLLENTITTQ